MNSGVIDNFLGIFTQYIDSGFGLLGPEVNFLARTLVLIDIILAALFWSWAGDEDIIARLIKKTLFVGVFAYLIANWQMLSKAVFESFAALGLKASGTGLAEADFLRPGRVAQVGLDAGQPILQSISGLMGFVSFFENFIQITVLLFAWAIVLISFFVLAIQLFVSLIEFKLSTLCGFVLIPFGLFGKTAFAAERVLGNVISSGVKVLVLAVIVGIGSTLFSTFTTSFPATPTISDAMGLVLASLSLLGLGIFGPSIANGIVSGGPQLGAGAAIGTGLAAGGVAATVIGGASLAVGAVGSGGAALAGAVRGGASLAGASVGAFSGWRHWRVGPERGCERRGRRGQGWSGGGRHQPAPPRRQRRWRAVHVWRPRGLRGDWRRCRRRRERCCRCIGHCSRKRSASVGAPDAAWPEHRPRRVHGRPCREVRRGRRCRFLGRSFGAS